MSRETLIVKRREWQRGKGKEGRLYDSISARRCIIGCYLHHIHGVTDEDMEDYEYGQSIAELFNDWKVQTPIPFVNDKSKDITQWTHDVIRINDALEFSDQYRETRLIQEFATYGCDLIFVD